MVITASLYGQQDSCKVNGGEKEYLTENTGRLQIGNMMSVFCMESVKETILAWCYGDMLFKDGK